MKRFVAIAIDGEVGVHAVGDGNYASLCGLDGTDDGVGQQTAALPLGTTKIDCPQCQALWRACRRYRAADFDGDDE